ncbi:acyltransferase family protein, partial [Oleiphilus sp. HI0086]
AILFFDESTPTPSYYTLLPTIGTALIILFTRAETLTFKLLSFKPAVSIGLISYSAYLWHQPVLAFARYYLIDSLTTLVLSLLCCLSFIMAYFSWRYVEKPFRRGTRFNQNRVLWVSSASLIFLGALGSYGNISNGFYDNRVEYPVVVNSELLKLAGEDRQKAIRAGECHFNRLGKYTDIDSFIDNWQCHSSSKSDDVSNILVFGDSHSADKALALRKNGLEVTQLGGAACVIAPDYVSQDRRYCSKLFSKAEELAKSNQLSGVFVSNRFIESELTLPYLEAIFEYWGAWDVPVFIFSPMPDFYLQIREFKLHGTTNISPSFSREEKFFSLLKHSSIPSNIEIVKTSELWCKDLSPSLERPCSVANQFSILMTNRDHVSTEGARVMGEQILVNPKLKSVVGNINSQFPTSN